MLKYTNDHKVYNNGLLKVKTASNPDFVCWIGKVLLHQQNLPLDFMNYLIIIVMPMKKWLFPEYHTSKHTSQTPHV